jgi:hypothetical protein
MDEQTKQLLIEYFKKAPADVQEMILSETITEDIQLISSGHGLSNDQKEALQSEVRLVLLGVTELEHFTENIREELAVDNKIASDIVLAIDNRIFSLVRESLNFVHGYAPATEIPSETNEGPADSLVVPKKETGDPVASSILGENRRPGAQSDPYREPIDEE